MVLGYEQTEKVLKETNDRYIVLSTEQFECREDEVKFSNAIEVLGLINTIHWANELYKSVNSEIRIPTAIFHKAIDAGLTNVPFGTDELTEYFNAIALIEDFFRSMIKFILLGYYRPYELEIGLFGLSCDEQDKLTSSQKNYLYDTYDNLSFKAITRNIDGKTFIDEFRRELKDLRKTVID